MENNEENKSNTKSTKKVLNIIKDFTIKKTMPTIETTTENTKKAVINVSNKAMNKVKTTITEEQMLEIQL